MYINKKMKISPITCLSCLCLLLSFRPINDGKSTSSPSPVG